MKDKIKKIIEILLFTGGVSCILSVLIVGSLFSLLDIPTLNNALGAFIPVVVSAEIALSGFSVAILVLLLSFILTHSENITNRNTYEELILMPFVVMGIGLAGSFFSALVLLLSAADNTGILSPITLALYLFIVLVSLIMTFSNFISLTLDITRYGLSQLRRGRKLTGRPNKRC